MTLCFFFPGYTYHLTFLPQHLTCYFSLCERSPREIKLHYAFSIYDFDGDNFIGVGDIEQVLPLTYTLWIFKVKIFFFRLQDCWHRGSWLMMNMSKYGERFWKKLTLMMTRSSAIMSSLMSSTNVLTSWLHSMLEFSHFYFTVSA